MDGVNGREFDTGRKLEQLEQGIFLERFNPMRETVLNEISEEDLIFGDIVGNELPSLVLPEGCDAHAACQIAILRQLHGSDGEIQPWLDRAIQEGWLVPGCGISDDDMSSLMRSAGLKVWMYDNCGLGDLLNALAENEKVLCSVSTLALEYPEESASPFNCADGVVQVLGVDMRDMDDVQVCLYNPLMGGVRTVSMQDFHAAWDIGGRKISCVSSKS